MTQQILSHTACGKVLEEKVFLCSPTKVMLQDVACVPGKEGAVGGGWRALSWEPMRFSRSFFLARTSETPVSTSAQKKKAAVGAERVGQTWMSSAAPV